MSWIPTFLYAKKCTDEGRGSVPMQIQITSGSSWDLSIVEIHKCNKCGYERTYPRYNEIPRIAEERIGRCGEWAILFGAVLTVLKIQARITHDSLDHVWNEALLQEKWVHIDSTLEYPVSLNHPYYYEQNWGKKYEYVLAFSENGCVEDVTPEYTQSWKTVLQRRESGLSYIR
jgi:peptide-N4-(N-acetyl-beta-glucosaminyl)asparagine amidase